MDVELLLGTEQALMLHSISTNNIIPCILIEVAVVINVYLVSFADEGVGHSVRELDGSHVASFWPGNEASRSCSCNGSKYSKTVASLTVLVSIGTCSAL